MNCSTFRTHWVNYTDLSSYNDYLLAAGEITTEQQEQALVVEMLQQYCDRVARYSTAGYSEGGPDPFHAGCPLQPEPLLSV